MCCGIVCTYVCPCTWPSLVLTSPKHMHTQFIIDFLRAVEDTKGNNGEKGKVPHTHMHTLTKLGTVYTLACDTADGWPKCVG